MKLSINTSYFPETNFYQRKEMMTQWRATSDYACKFAWICAALSLASSCALFFIKDTFFFVFLGSAALYLLGALLSKKWKYLGYISVLIAEFMSLCRFYLDIPENKMVLGIAAVVSLFGLVPSYFAYKCVYNYKSVFKELEKCEGFPNFIANTADLFGDKLYIHDEEATVYESRKEASFNPFNSEEEIRSEEVRRYQDARVKTKAEPIKMNLTADGNFISAEEEEAIRKAKKAQERKGGVFIGNFELIFAHGDLNDRDFDQKRILMGKWRGNNELATKNFITFAFILMMAVLTSGFGSFMGIVNNFVVVLFIIGTNQMKMGKWYAPITVIVSIIYSLLICANSAFSLFFLLAAYIYNFGLVISVIRYILNYKIYKALSTQEGFPTFIRNTADLYGDKLYIVEKRPSLKKGEFSDRPVKVMDIGYDNTTKKDEGAWNAFNYMDEKEDGNEG